MPLIIEDSALDETIKRWGPCNNRPEPPAYIRKRCIDKLHEVQAEAVLAGRPMTAVESLNVLEIFVRQMMDAPDRSALVHWQPPFSVAWCHETEAQIVDAKGDCYLTLRSSYFSPDEIAERLCEKLNANEL